MNAKLYDTLKYIAQIGLPAVIAFYGVVAIAWGFAYTEQILTTLGALNVLLGALLAKSSADYYKEQAK